MPADDGSIENNLTPELEAEIRKFWEPIIYNVDGTLNERQVLAELGDYHHLLEAVPEVYDAITGGRLSKPNYTASTVLSVHSEHMEELFDDVTSETAKDVLDMVEAGHTRDEILKEYPPHDYTNHLP